MFLISSSMMCFPFVESYSCAFCERPLTAGFVQGKKKKPYPRYWCWSKKKDCPKRFGVGRDTLQAIFVGLLERMTPGTKGLGMIPEIAARTPLQDFLYRKDRITEVPGTSSQNPCQLPRW